MQPTNTCALLLRSATGRVAYVTGPAVTRYYARAARMGLQLAVLHGSISDAVWQSLPLPQRQRLHMRGITTVHTFGGNVAPFGLPQFVQRAVYNTGMWARA